MRPSICNLFSQLIKYQNNVN